MAEGEEQKKQGYRQRIRAFLQDMRKGMEMGDKKSWYHFWMGLLVMFVGFMLCATVVVDFFLELQAYRTQDKPVIEKTINAKLPAGEYGMLDFRSTSVIGAVKTDENGAPQKRDVVMVCSKEGGVVVAAPVPDGVELPKEWYGVDSYVLVVDSNGVWVFKQTPAFTEGKKEMERVRAEYEKHMGEMKKPAGNGEPSPGIPQPAEQAQ